MFDANLRHFRPGRDCLIHIMALSSKSPLYLAGFRKDDYVVGRVTEQAQTEYGERATVVEIQLAGVWHCALHETVSADEWLVFEEIIPTLIEPIRANDPRQRITRV